ncbi:helix-turn-helix domain-containing protein [Microbacterium sp. SORGH_AS_0888]|uniref:helix-turn-helix domain-containing protein n=1 Tax=Microbacterium sp. SORGH_AS_0888 TaxID=3041791 RepID=UPI002787F886|nr:helix-turn-helix transcriptional regulator [Microbacterium sp. SORGH_AS_0888]MDQ1131031.1 transcriptional regulator with XRE-family HTH domain [Microbacterium sp. SORGH_AS_0888]
MVSGCNDEFRPTTTPAWAEFSWALGLQLRRARDAKNLTQEAMAERAGISLYAYQQYERGAVTKNGAATNPRLATILAICQALDTPIEELLPPVPPLTTN